MIHSSTNKIWNCKILQFSPPVTKTQKQLVQNLKIFSIRTEKREVYNRENVKKNKRSKERDDYRERIVLRQVFFV